MLLSEREREGKREREKGIRNSTITLWMFMWGMFEQFQCHVFEESQEFGGATVPEKTVSRERKQRQDPLQSRR